MTNAMGQKSVLLPHDLAGHLEDGSRTLVEALDQPVGVVEAVGEIFLGVLVAGTCGHAGIIAGVDEKSRQGLRIELKYFFTAAIQSVDGAESHSAEAVRDRIRELIDTEDREILSDDRIVAMLTVDGVNIARRTVAKYREAMRIPSSVERRREKCSRLSLIAAGH